MALAPVGRMAISTLLTLFVVPAAYSTLDDVLEWNRGRCEALVGFIPALRRLRRAR